MSDFHMISGGPRPVAPFSHAVEADGWVILKVEGRRSISLPSFDQSKDDILDFLAERAVADKLRELRAEADVVLFEPAELPLSVPEEEPESESLAVTPKP